MATIATKETKIGFNRGFKEFNECRKRYRLAKGSAGSGKSVDIAQDLQDHAGS